MPETLPLDESANSAAAPADPASVDSDLINPSLRVADAMTAGPRTCSPHSTVLEAVMFFRDADCGAIPITDMGKPLGILTDRDVALAVAEHQGELSRLPVSELMNNQVLTINVDDTIATAMDMLGDHGVRRLLVVDSAGVLQGVLSWTDLVPHLSPCGLGHVVSRIVENR
ncbi:Hypoxic response protein 1 [Aquisphaera giovannonii]|uniref:Hypoxic response protein 1 n=1 Tax=Aquisphaera giovannonii TaxID=406548 RepID=A0A5B9VZ84_9BACT|nr:CBS domain-containing protein [Aquisphaera giovannonii]QEH33662.1 Hypoxic response protein 1 [Aquisphaera giovannonii]